MGEITQILSQIQDIYKDSGLDLEFENAAIFNLDLFKFPAEQSSEVSLNDRYLRQLQTSLKKRDENTQNIIVDPTRKKVCFAQRHVDHMTKDMTDDEKASFHAKLTTNVKNGFEIEIISNEEADKIIAQFLVRIEAIEKLGVATLVSEPKEGKRDAAVVDEATASQLESGIVRPVLFTSSTGGKEAKQLIAISMELARKMDELKEYSAKSFSEGLERDHDKAKKQIEKQETKDDLQKTDIKKQAAKSSEGQSTEANSKGDIVAKYNKGPTDTKGNVGS